MAASSHLRPISAKVAKKKIGTLMPKLPARKSSTLVDGGARKGLFELCTPLGEGGREDCGEGVDGRREWRGTGGLASCA